jgi:hypothetical protein
MPQAVTIAIGLNVMCVNKWLDNFYKDKADVDFLNHIKQVQEKGDHARYRLNKSLCIKNELGYEKKEDQFNQRSDSLINCGYLIQPGHDLFITEEGKNYLKDYNQFQKLGIFAKFTKIYQQNFSPIPNILAVILSVFSLLVAIVAIMKP